MQQLLKNKPFFPRGDPLMEQTSDTNPLLSNKSNVVLTAETLAYLDRALRVMNADDVAKSCVMVAIERVRELFRRMH
jgi:hypothetical protein